MTTLASIASSGLRTTQLQMNTSAHNVANMNTPEFHRQKVALQVEPDQGGVRASVQRESRQGVALEQEAVEQMSATYAFKANLQAFETADRMLGVLLNTQA